MPTKNDASHPPIDFLVIGAYRSGTTWLHSILERHNNIYVTPEKEIMFFSHHYEKGVDWYTSFFSRRPSDAVTGEVCPTYLADPRCPDRIHHILPNVKIVAILRQPTQQILSHYKLRQSRGLTSRPISEDVRADDTYLSSVRYYQHLTPYIERFGRDNVLILFYEELKNSPETFLAQFYDFLGVSQFLPDNLASPINASRTAKIRGLEVAISSTARFLRRSGLVKLKQALGKSRLHQVLRRLNQRETIQSESVRLSDADIAFIDCSTANDRKLLGELLDRDLSKWM